MFPLLFHAVLPVKSSLTRTYRHLVASLIKLPRGSILSQNRKGLHKMATYLQKECKILNSNHWMKTIISSPVILTFCGYIFLLLHNKPHGRVGVQQSILPVILLAQQAFCCNHGQHKALWISRLVLGQPKNNFRDYKWPEHVFLCMVWDHVNNVWYNERPRNERKLVYFTEAVLVTC